MADRQVQSIPEAELLAQLRTRGFEEGFQRSPLRDFRGRLISITGQLVTSMTPPATEVLYNFEQVEVLESTEPYAFPVAQVSLFQNNRERSPMGVLGTSIDRIINAGVPEDALPEQVKGQSFLIGKMQRWKLTGGHMMWDRRAVNAANPSKPGAEVPRDAWEVLEVEGFVTPVVAQAARQPGTVTPTAIIQPQQATKPKSALQIAVELLDGRTDAQFATAAFSNEIVKKDGKIVTALLGGQFIPGLVVAGIVTKNGDGTYTVNKVLAANL